MQRFRHWVLSPVIAALLTVGAAACRFQQTPEDPVSPLGGTGSVTYGRMHGYAALVNTDGSRLGDKSGIRVQVEGTALSAVTAKGGEWIIEGLPAGTYDMTWTKEGFGFTKKRGVRFNGQTAGLGPKAFVVEVPAFTVALTADSLESDELVLAGQLRGRIPVSPVIRLFLATSPAVSASPAQYRASLAFAPDIPVVIDPDPDDGEATVPFQIRINVSRLEESGWKDGITGYIVAHADAGFAQSYTDSLSGREVFTTLNPFASNVRRVALPH
jgi:hypothetical protein